jgi:hypothetical protein
MKQPPTVDRAAFVVIGVLLLVATTSIDYLTGYELHFFVFYYLPIAFVAWYVGRSAAFALSVVAAAAWYVVEATTRPTDVSVAYGVWNTALRLFSFLIIAVVLSRIRRDSEREREANQKLARALADVEKSVEDIRRLQSQLQTVCAWTQRIKDEGEWIGFEEFMMKYFRLRFSHGISEDALQELQKQFEEADGKSAE